ncbi:unnamed protein product [Peniophora sp. CBMAI 1063]|nr:unnamed protein product [Peniophora sp. CBMAI 1063]
MAVNSVRTKVIDAVTIWSVGHLYQAIGEGKVRNAAVYVRQPFEPGTATDFASESLTQQLRGLSYNWCFVAANHTDVVYADDQVISGVTPGDMAKLGYLDPEFYLLIEDVPGTDHNDPQRAREFVLVSRLDISPVLAY